MILVFCGRCREILSTVHGPTRLKNLYDLFRSNCVICLCPDKKVVLQEAYRVLKVSWTTPFHVTAQCLHGSLVAVVPTGGRWTLLQWHVRQQGCAWAHEARCRSVGWYISQVEPFPGRVSFSILRWPCPSAGLGEGMGGSLFWQDFISLAQAAGFSRPHLVSSSRIVVHDSELKAKAGNRSTFCSRSFWLCSWSSSVLGDIQYASGTYRLFKLPKSPVLSGATVTYRGTVADFPEELEFDSSHCFKVF